MEDKTEKDFLENIGEFVLDNWKTLGGVLILIFGIYGASKAGPLAPIIGVYGIVAFGMMIFGAVIGSVFLWIGAKIAGIEEATFGNALRATIGMYAVNFVVAGVLSSIPGPLAFLIGLTVALYIIQTVFDTTFVKAFVAWILSVVATAVVMVGTILIFIVGIAQIIK